MRNLAKTYLKYGVPSNLASKYDSLGLSVTEFRVLSLSKLQSTYSIAESEAKIVKEYLTRQAIDFAVIQGLLENNNFTCCCCKGVKSDGYVIHHIIKYELSQDNTYPNLAVLCPNDHDLAHRATGLTSGISEDQIRAAKQSWEQIVQIHRLAAASPEDLNKFYLRIPRYQVMLDEMETLKNTIREKQAFVDLNVALAASELENNNRRLNLLQEEKSSLESQVNALIEKLSKFQPEEVSKLCSASITKVLAGDIAGALAVLNEKQLDAQKDELLSLQSTMLNGLSQNIDERIFRAILLLLNGEASEACDFAGQTLKTCDELSDKFSELLFRNVACYEEVGTIYFNADLLDQAEAVFNNGLEMASNMLQGDPSITPFIPDFLHNLGTIYYARGDFEAAKDNLENSMAWYESLQVTFKKIPGVEVGRFDAKLIKNLVNLATTYNAMGESHKANETFDRIEQFRGEVLSSDNQSPEQQVRYLSSKANLMLSSGEALKASKLFEELIPLLETLSKKFPSMYAREFTNTCLELCAAGLMIESTPQEMERYCGQALDAARGLMVSEPFGDPSPLAYALLYYALHMLRTEGKNTRCIAAAEEANAIVKNLLPTQGDLQLIEGLKGLMSVLKA